MTFSCRHAQADFVILIQLVLGALILVLVDCLVLASELIVSGVAAVPAITAFSASLGAFA